MELINEKDETLMSISVETQGCKGASKWIRIPGGPSGNCVFSKLMQSGYTVAPLASPDEKDLHAQEYLYRLVYPEREQNINKMHPCCLRLAPIIQKCKFGIAANVAHNVISREINTFPTRLTYMRKLWSMDACLKKTPHTSANQAGGFGKGFLAKWQRNI